MIDGTIVLASIHVTLMLLLTLHASQVDTHLQPYTRGLSDEVWLLLSGETNAIELFTMNDTIQHMHDVLDNYFELPQTALGNFHIADCNIDNQLLCPVLVVQSKVNQTINTYKLLHKKEQTWPIGLRRPISLNASRNFFDELQNMEMILQLESQPPSTGQFTAWNISILYDFSSQGQLHGTIQLHRLLPSLLLETIPTDFVPRKYITQSDPWLLLVFGMNIGIIGVCFQAWRYADHLAYYEQLSLTFATVCALAWITSLRYLHSNERFRILGLTIRRGLPRVIEFLIGVGPLFVGYVLFGSVMFGNHVPRFQGLMTTATTLFAIANGDEVRMTFDSLSTMPWLGQIYLYSYIMLFTYVVLMVCIGIIEDAFFSSAFPTLWKQPVALSPDTIDQLQDILLAETPIELQQTQVEILNRVRLKLEQSHKQT
ncbi:hypothetical protein THRCLA_05056 [Thraustotheca clavata]|uniref:Polycystin cation channel PKD1/PKD2 domain-containing protein n=1 Tax=Thraustotheca clavata TaxID=74557 RepID=A0A1V9ZX40_9STRA|nr:hypothetical protein THRCLA_05056 [Thraustotheca clavata]